MKALTLILLTFSIMVAFSHATPILITHPQPQLTKLVSGSCNYLVTIKTSCSSPPHTADEISLLFGDVNGSELYVQRLNGPESETFEQCSTISFEILGPCVGKICQLYLFRNGTDGWMPETVTANYNDYPPVTFNYNIFIPQGVSSGFNYCDDKN
ncbi:embryo-specific protein ATS3B [Trifolium repens]|nr:embryo-specific protein ATS3B [Trifolium repens]